MPCHIESGLYVRIVELPKGPNPMPLSSGFSTDTAYRVLGLESFSESAESFLILSNDADQIWFISNRHVRTALLDNMDDRLRIPLAELHPVRTQPRRILAAG